VFPIITNCLPGKKTEKSLLRLLFARLSWGSAAGAENSSKRNQIDATLIKLLTMLSFCPIKSQTADRLPIDTAECCSSLLGS
jgi:hypothetical protein